MKTLILFPFLFLTLGLAAQVDTAYLKDKQKAFLSLGIDLKNYDYTHPKINQDLREILKSRSRYHFTKTVGYALFTAAAASTVMSFVSVTGVFDESFCSPGDCNFPTLGAMISFLGIGIALGTLSLIPITVIATAQKTEFDRQVRWFRYEHESELQISPDGY